MAQITIYTDGAASPNPGRGGYAAVIVGADGYAREVSGGYRLTTNNRMELMAAIAGLTSVGAGRTRVHVVSDSQYVVQGASRWAPRWRARSWRKRDGRAPENVDLWARLLALCDAHDVSFAWVRGHAGNRLNEQCDQLAATAAASAVDADPGFAC